MSEIDYMNSVFKSAEKKYKDIIDMEYTKSANRPQMSLHDRAAQFAPFSALTGHEEAIEETARLTEEKIILDEAAKEVISRKLYEIAQNIEKRWSVAITYFKADRLKNGGVYLTDVGIIKKIDEVEKMVIMDNGMRIEIDGIVGVEIGKAH